MSAVCNIGPQGRKIRRLLGVAMLLGCAVMAVILRGSPLPAAVRAGLFVPALFGFLGVFQAQDGTCVALAQQGMMDMDEGPQPLTDPAGKVTIARQVRGVWVKSVLAALLTAVLAVWA